MRSKKERAKAVDLIYVPKGLKERCSNCSFLDKDTNLCKHKEVLFVIQDPEEECCGRWDHPYVDRRRTQ